MFQKRLIDGRVGAAYIGGTLLHMNDHRIPIQHLSESKRHDPASQGNGAAFEAKILKMVQNFNDGGPLGGQIRIIRGFAEKRLVPRVEVQLTFRHDVRCNGNVARLREVAPKAVEMVLLRVIAAPRQPNEIFRPIEVVRFVPHRSRL